MSVKFSPSTDWMVQSQYRKEYILQVVGETITRKKWRSSLYNANNDFPASGEVMEDGFSINFSNLEKKSRSELRVPLKVKMRLEGKLALLDCKVGFSDVKLFFMILFYAFWRMLAYMMGIRRGDVGWVVTPLAIAGVHYLITMILFNREMLVYKSYVRQLAGEVK